MLYVIWPYKGIGVLDLEKIQKIWFCFLFTIFSDLFMKYFLTDFFLYKPKIFSRFQKSYLENHASILKVPKMEITSWQSLFNGFSMIYVHFYVALPLKFQKFPNFSRFRKFRDIYLRDEEIFCFRKKNIKIQNLFRNPKITLRKSCEHFKIV